MKELSEWQLARVRDTLRAFHRYERDADGEYFTWKDVHRAIAEYTGVEIGTNLRSGAERLRQFVEGVEDKNAPGGRKFPTPKPTALEAIVAFVTHEEINLLNEEELKEFRPGFQATLRLTEFLRQDCDFTTDTALFPIAGQYMSGHLDKDGWTIRILFLNCPSDDGIAQVVETHIYYATEKAEEALKWYNEGSREKAMSLVQYGGWAIITPEDSLIIFLKHKVNGRNHRYIGLEELCLLHEKKSWVFKDIAEPNINEGIFLLLHDYGHDLSIAPNEEDITRTLKKDLFAFQKMPEANT